MPTPRSGRLTERDSGASVRVYRAPVNTAKAHGVPADATIFLEQSPGVRKRMTPEHAERVAHLLLAEAKAAREEEAAIAK